MTKKLKGYGTFDVVLIVILVIVSFACVYPFWYVFANSFASYNVASRGAVAWWPSELSLDGYQSDRQKDLHEDRNDHDVFQRRSDPQLYSDE